MNNKDIFNSLMAMIFTVALAGFAFIVVTTMFGGCMADSEPFPAFPDDDAGSAGDVR